MQMKLSERATPTRRRDAKENEWLRQQTLKMLQKWNPKKQPMREPKKTLENTCHNV